MHITCFRCKGKGGRLLAPRTKGRRSRFKRSYTEWVKCDLCHGSKVLFYPLQGDAP